MLAKHLCTLNASALDPRDLFESHSLAAFAVPATSAVSHRWYQTLAGTKQAPFFEVIDVLAYFKGLEISKIFVRRSMKISG
jgi:hypothetical protein